MLEIWLWLKEIFGAGWRWEGLKPPQRIDAEGAVRFWIKDGLLSEFKIKFSGTVTAGEREAKIKCSFAGEIKDADTPKMEGVARS